MKAIAFVVWSCLLLGGCNAPAPRESTVDSPVTVEAAASATPDAVPARPESREVLRAPPPEGWRQITQVNRADTRLLEFMPPSSSAIANDETLRLESFRRSPLPTVTALLNDLSGDYQQHCPRADVQLIRQDTENGFPIELRLLICPAKVPSGPTLQMLKAIRGDDWFYVISRSSRDAKVANTAELEPRLAAWSIYMRDVLLCVPDSVAHPCTNRQRPAR